MEVKNNISAEQLIQLLKDNNPADFLREFLGQDDEAYPHEVFNYGNTSSALFDERVEFTIGGITIKQVDFEGQYNDGADIASIVGVFDQNGDLLTVNGKAALIRVETFYSSWDSPDWDYSYAMLVEPRDVVITQYFALDGSDDDDSIVYAE